jgi:branched-chain amino acid transport system permease protein
VLGAIVIGALTSGLRDSFRFWEIGIAVLFIVVVLLFPQGLIGVLAPLERWWNRGVRSGTAIAAPARAGADASARLEVGAVEVQVGEVRILDRLSFAFERPGIYCVIGPNGAGKTSTFNVLTGELRARAGGVAFDGRAIDRLSTHRIVRLGIGRKFQVPSVFAPLTIADNIAIALWSGRARPLALLRPRLRRWSSPVLTELQARYPFLADATRTASQLSHGERQILELAMALLGEPRLLLLDEPCAGLSPQETAAAIDLIRWASQRRGATIVVIEHDMSLVRKLADHVFVLHNGSLIAEGSVEAIQANTAVQAIYVGAEK